MVKPEYALAGSPCWIDLLTSDADRAIDFYGTLFGWTAERTGPEFGGYINFLKDGERIAGAMANDGSTGAPDMWTIYLRVTDAAATVKAAAEHGGQVYLEPMAVGELGSMAMLADAGGATVGLWQPGQHTGFARVVEPDAPSWFELFTRDHAAMVAFYRDVFGWQTASAGDTDEFRYTTLGEDERAAAGIMDASGFLPEGVPAHWSVYFGTADIDASVATVLSGGGAVVVAPEDTPFGRLATVTDPTGTQFKFVQPPA
jgi:hypothetical protein